jgi:NAD(P)-dependent dehydrogenase (short-subunit alcohol dehydrogenase family)
MAFSATGSAYTAPLLHHMKVRQMDTVPQAPLILITGGGRGIGAATARLAAAQGYDVAISFVSNESAALAVAADVEAVGRRALPVRADSADPEQVAQLFAAIDREFGRIDVLVNNAAVLAPQSRLEDLEFERMRRIFAVNSIGPILCAQQAVKRMSYRHNGRGGAVINISSASARLGSPNEYVDYAASKGAVETFTIGFAKEVAREGYASTAFALGTSTLTCMPAAESRDGWIASKTRSPWEEAVSLKRLRGRSYGWQAPRLPSSPARSSMSPAASEQLACGPFPRRTVLIVCAQAGSVRASYVPSDDCGKNIVRSHRRPNRHAGSFT